MAFKRANRSITKALIGLAGPSGSGKTFSALLLAGGLAPNRKIFLIDTESGRGSFYEGFFPQTGEWGVEHKITADYVPGYFTQEISAPYTPEKYISAIEEAEAEGAEVIIVDSATHLWSKEGGALDMQGRIAESTKNSYTAWRPVTPKVDKFQDKLLSSKCHVIFTLRSKVKYEMTDDKKVKKLGMEAIFREGLDYETTCFADLNITNNLASFSKDVLHIFGMDVPLVITKSHGDKIREWFDARKHIQDPQPAPTPCPAPQSPEIARDLPSNSEASEASHAPSEPQKPTTPTISWGKLAVARKETSKVIGREITDEDLTAFGFKAFKKASKTEWTEEEKEVCLKWLRRLYEAKKYDGFLDGVA